MPSLGPIGQYGYHCFWKFNNAIVYEPFSSTFLLVPFIELGPEASDKLATCLLGDSPLTNWQRRTIISLGRGPNQGKRVMIAAKVERGETINLIN